MPINNTRTVDDYAAMVCEMQGALANLQEFVDSLPAPDDESGIPMDYAELGDVARLHRLITEACQLSDEMSK